MAHVKIINEIPKERNYQDWQLCFQQCVYYYDNGATEEGYRFIWRRPGGSLQAARGQARLPDRESIERLLEQAQKEGWL